MQASLRNSVRTSVAIIGTALMLAMPVAAQAHGNHDKPNKKAPPVEPQPDPTIPTGPGDIANNDPQPDPQPDPQIPPGPGDLTAPAPTPDPCPGPCDIKDNGGGGGGGGDFQGPGDLTNKPQEPGDTPTDPAPKSDPVGEGSGSADTQDGRVVEDVAGTTTAADAGEATLAAAQAPTAGSLPYTGAETWMVALLGVALLGAGAASWRMAGATGRS